jgi:signal transduction histidine kinase
MPVPEEAEKRLRELMAFVLFTEGVALNVHGVAGDAAVLRVVNKAFAASLCYLASILLLSEDRTRLRVTGPAAYPPLQGGESGGLAPGYEIKLGRSKILSRVVKERQAQVVDLMTVLAEFRLLPPFSPVVKAGYTQSGQSLILAPLQRGGEVFGILTVLAPDLPDYYLPTVANLARHVDSALEVMAEAALRRGKVEKMKTDRLDSVGTLAGGIAHNFNNLLTGILGNISLAKTHLSPGEKAYDLLTESEDLSLKARELASRLLTLAPGGAPLKKMARIDTLIKDWVKYSLRGSHTRSTFTLSDDLWLVEVDREQFGQVIGNLIANADQAMRGAGSIAIAAENAHISAGDVPWLAAGRYIKISITDRGQGIPPERLSRIFDPFFTTGEPGRGLGLTIAYSIIQRHGGHVTVVSKPEEGTTFTIYLPAAGAEPSPL